MGIERTTNCDESCSSQFGITHHLQVGVTAVPTCIRDQEIEAYKTQLKYLAEFHPSATDARLAVERSYALLIDGDCDAGSLTK